MKLKTHSAPAQVVFFFDIDNTLLDNDAVTEDLHTFAAKEIGDEGAQRYWFIFETLRTELGYADYLGALQRYRSEFPRDLRILKVSRFLINYPFANRLFPRALDVIAHVKQWGAAALLSDGDVLFQPHKAERSRLGDAVDGNVLIYAHKELELEDAGRRHPAKHYVLVDDKLKILTAAKAIWGAMVTTVFVQQGHYAHDPEILATFPPADLSIESIGHLIEHDLEELTCRHAHAVGV